MSPIASHSRDDPAATVAVTCIRAAEYRKDVENAGMRASMSRNGNCYDNAPTESFWGHVTQELRMRRHSALGNTAPSVFAEAYYSQRRVA